MIYPMLMLKHLKVRRAIRDYPLYDVPNKQQEEMLDELRVQENFDYFMRFASTGWHVSSSGCATGLESRPRWMATVCSRSTPGPTPMVVA